MQRRTTIIASAALLCMIGLYWALHETNPESEIVSRTVAQLSDANAPEGFVSARVLFEVNTQDGSAKACAEVDGKELCARQALPDAQRTETGRYSVIPPDALTRAERDAKGTNVYVYDNRQGQIFRYSLEGVNSDRTLVLNVMPVKSGPT